MDSETTHLLIKNDDEVLAHSSLESHPDEVLCQIFEYLPITNRVAIGRVSKRVHRIATDINGKVKSLFTTSRDEEPYWFLFQSASFCPIEDHKFGKDWLFVPKFLIHVIKALPNLKALHIDDFSNHTNEVLSEVQAHPNLEHIGIAQAAEFFDGFLTVRYGQFESQTLTAVDIAAKQLEGSKVTCLLENWFSPISVKTEQLSNLKYVKQMIHQSHPNGHEIDQWRSLLRNGLLGSFGFNCGWEPLPERFWTALFEDGSWLEYLEALALGIHLERIIDGGLPNLKHLHFDGSVLDLKNVLKLPNIESVGWKPANVFSHQELRDALLVNGKKLKRLDITIMDHGDAEEPELLELEMFKVVAENCSNLESLDLCFDGVTIEYTAQNIVKLPLGQLLPRLHFLDLFITSGDPSHGHELFRKMPRLKMFLGHLPGNDLLHLERRGRRIADFSDRTVLAALAQNAN